MEYLPTILICLVLACIVGGIVYRWIRNKKKGKSNCCSSCAGCSMSQYCHPQKKQDGTESTEAL